MTGQRPDNSRGFTDVLAALCLFLLSVATAWAQQAPGQQTMTPTAEQLRMLEQLSPQERERLMRQFGIPSTPSASTAAPEFPQVVIPPEQQLPPGGDAFAGTTVPEPTRIEPGATLIVDLMLPPEEETNAAERREIEELLAEYPRLKDVEGSAPYVVGDDGYLEFPGITRVYVAGLTPLEAAQRIEAERIFRKFYASVIYLPIAPTGVLALERFGQELFSGVPTTFAPATDVPVPADYVLGPGDEVRVQLFGNQNAEYSLSVSRDGSISLPGLGPVTVAGLDFGEARHLLEERISDQMIGVKASITMGLLRSIRVFVLGDVIRPGTFTVSSLSSMTNALFVSGGLSEIGSLRKVQLKRRGRLISELDLYDLLLRGDNSDDARLEPDDVIFVPPVGDTVAIGGEVRRPAIYELRGEQTLREVVTLAGGLTSAAYPRAIRIERIGEDLRRQTLTVDLATEQGRSAPVRDGDVVTVSMVIDRLEGAVSLQGAVHRPGSYQWRPGTRLTDLLPAVAMLKPGADTGYLLIERLEDPSGPVEAVSADLEAALRGPGGEHDVLLEERDVVHVFSLEAGRRAVVDPLLQRLRLQATFGSPAKEVGVDGMVRAPGTYPLEPGMRISDLIRAGANLTDAAYTATAELMRYPLRGSEGGVELIQIDLASLLAGDPQADLVLQPFDFLSIRELPQWQRRAVVELSGEVRFPGRYQIEQGETLSSVIQRAGGLTGHAFPEGSVLLRADLREREERELERLATRLEAELATLALQATSGAAALQQSTRGVDDTSLGIGQSLLAQLHDAEPMGRLVIDLPTLLAGRPGYDVIMQDGDQLMIPQVTQEVTVLGEVQYATSHLHSPKLTRTDYVERSGGLTANADEDRIYVVRASGEVVTSKGSSRWFRADTGQEVRPGDTIVVPMDIDRVPSLALWQSSTSILYNLAIAVAAVGSL